MKLLEQYQSSAGAESAGKRLEEQGIPVHISSKYSNSFGGVFTGAFKVGLWVLVDEQFEEAQKLLADPTYRVKKPLSKERQLLLRHTARDQAFWTIIRISIPIVVLLLLVFLIVALNLTPSPPPLGLNG